MEAARVAGPDDLAVATALATEAVETPRRDEREQRHGDVWYRRDAPVDVAAWIRHAVEADDHVVVIGTIDDTPVSIAMLVVTHDRHGVAVGDIPMMHTVAGARGVGVAEAVLEVVLSEADARGCQGIDAWALPGDRATKNFWETFGFTARRIIVHRRAGS